jgi:hypothetical protein
VIARNAHKRPTLQHRLDTYARTACGIDIRHWPFRAYGDRKIKELYCMKCSRLEGAHR